MECDWFVLLQGRLLAKLDEPRKTSGGGGMSTYLIYRDVVQYQSPSPRLDRSQGKTGHVAGSFG